MQLDKITANNRSAEMQLIAWIAVFNKFIDIPDSYFFDSEILALYKHYQTQYTKNGEIDPYVIPEGMEILFAECYEMSTSPKPDIVLAELKKYWKIRELYKTMGRIDNLISSDFKNIDDAIDLLTKKNSELILEENNKKYEHDRSVYQYTVGLEEAIKSGRTMRGHRSHLPDVDKIISGWEQGKFYLLSGLEKLGKSRFTRNLISTWLNDKKGCICCLLEEDAAAIHQCVFAARVGVNTDTMGTADLHKDSLTRICREAKKYMEQPLYVYSKSGMNPNNIKTIIQDQKITFSKSGHEVVFVVIDYIQRMTMQGGNGKYEETELIASELANIARDENVCMIGVSQMASGAEKTKGLPLHTMIRYGKPFKEAASCIITLDDPERRGNTTDENMSVDVDHKTIIANIIQRSGMSNINISLRAQLQYSRFENYAI
jgi:replicative DNA helicase